MKRNDSFSTKKGNFWVIGLVIIFLAIVFVIAACTLSATLNPDAALSETISAQSTWIAHLSTQVAGQEESNDSQWEAIGQLYTQMPYALGIMTPTPPGQLITRTPTPYSPSDSNTLPTLTPYLDIEYPPETRTGVDEIDIVIDAFLKGDEAARLDLVRYANSACVSGCVLCDPPNCIGEEADGTLVDVFPLYNEGKQYFRPRDIQGIFGFAVRGLLAVYKVPEETFRLDYWPAGEYGVVFTSEEGGAPHIIIVLIEDGEIVRMDLDYTWPPFATVRDRSNEFLLTPIR
ncbi:MAG TPA: hypothetical protein DCY42_05745 [Chloroflexi bacterium]|nr:hypothetical protein [Chloroflexota bacterium]